MKRTARIVMDIEKRCTGKDLAEALARRGLTDDQARIWHRDLRAARRRLKAPDSKWR